MDICFLFLVLVYFTYIHKQNFGQTKRTILDHFVKTLKSSREEVIYFPFKSRVFSEWGRKTSETFKGLRVLLLASPANLPLVSITRKLNLILQLAFFPWSPSMSIPSVYLALSNSPLGFCSTDISIFACG